jgi:DNA-binding response OmpR family regulator
MSKKILVADGSPTVRKVTESLLKKKGYEVLCAEDGTSALSLAKTNPPDLIFLDDSLPTLDGFSVCEELKRNDKLKDIPVIMLLYKPWTEKESKEVGADAFLVKPLNPKDILENVEKFLEKENTPLKAQNSSFRDKSEIRPEGKKSKNELVPGDGKSSTKKTEVRPALSKKEEKNDDSLDIIETSDFLESLQSPPSDSGAKEPHGFEWFMWELKKEVEEAGEVNSGAKQESKEKLNSIARREDLRKKDKDEKKAKVYQIDEDQEGFENFANEIKDKLEEFDESIEPEVKKSFDHKIPALNYDGIIQALIENLSTKIAQEVAKKIDPEILERTLRKEIEKLRKEVLLQFSYKDS